MKINTNKNQLKSFAQSLLFWKGRHKGMITTRDIKWDDIRAVFFPKTFHERYRYLGSIPWNEDGDIFQAMEPLVIFMDYKSKPKWCPRWILRFLYLFGKDNSIVRVRNWTLYNLLHRITRGYMIIDYKTKWTSYDLRISVHADNQLFELASDIEASFYRKGLRTELIESIRCIEPDFKQDWMETERLKDYLNNLEQDNE